MSVTNRVKPAEAGTSGRWSPRHGRRAAKIVLLLAIVLVTVVAAGGYLTSERLAAQVHRYAGVFDRLDGRTRPPATGAPTFLLVVGDSLRPNLPAGSPAFGGAMEYPSDAIMFVRIAADYSAATVVSLCGDSMVNLPGRGPGRIDESYALGGPPLLVRAVERLTHIRIDHFAAIDFAGLRALADTLGGVEVNITGEAASEPVGLHPGDNQLDGTQLLAYLRQADNLPDGAASRMRRLQNALYALLAKANEADVLSNPLRAYGFLDTLSQWIGVDDTLSNRDLRTLIWRLRGLSPEDITFLTAPVATPRDSTADKPQSRPDTTRVAEFWAGGR